MTNGEEAGKAGGIRSSKLKLAIIVVVAIAISGVGGMEFMEYMSRDATCGAICHNHQPFYDKYQGTVHQTAEVACVGCHERPGAVGFVKNQIVNSGNMFKYYILRGKYKKDFAVIMAGTPRERYIPPMETCTRDGCHDESRFVKKGVTRGYDFVVAAEVGQLVNEETNERNTEGILAFHQLHIQSPTEEWTAEPTCNDCHGNVMFDEYFYEDKAYLDVEDAATSGPFPLRGGIYGGTLQRIPATVCLDCHDGERAPAIYGE
ncbi:MAG: NapC/NirT family cytochrome c [Candidatus Hydrothermarchaeales archaeon]